MRDLLLNNGLMFVWLMAVIEMVTGLLFLRGRKNTVKMLCIALCFGLTIDAAIIGAGIWIGEGKLLQSISQVRYLLHGVLVPLLIPIAFLSYGVKHKITSGILWGVTAVVIVLGIVMGIQTKTVPETMAGVLRYTSSEDTPMLARTMDRVLSIGGVIPLICVGLVHLIRHKRVWLMLSGIAMFAFAALAPATGNLDLNFLITMFGEALMVIFLYLEARKDA